LSSSCLISIVSFSWLISSVSILYGSGSNKFISFIFLLDKILPLAFTPFTAMNFSKLMVAVFLSFPFSFTKTIFACGRQSVDTISSNEFLCWVIKFIFLLFNSTLNLFTK